MSDDEEAIARLTARRGDRYREVREQAEDHAAGHGCVLRTLTELEARELAVLVRATHSSYVLQLGTGVGYASLQIAGGFGATGRLDAIEPDAVHAGLTVANMQRFGLGERLRMHTTGAREVVPALSGPYDLAVLDGAWADYAPLFDDLLRLLRVGGSLWTIPREGFPDAAADPFLARLAEDERVLTWFAPGLRRVLAVRLR